jgi:amino acid transporter
MTTRDNPLKRSLSLPVVTLYGLGTIIGAGIYVLIGEVATRSSYLTPLAFLLASVIAAFSAFSYAELSARFPLSAGEAVYIERAFNNRWLAVVVGLMMVFIGIVASATLVRGFIGYFQLIIDLDSHLITMLLVVVIGGIVAWGISQSAGLAAVTTLIEIGGLLLIIWVSRDQFSEIPRVIEQATLAFPDVGWKGVTAGAFIAFFAFLGFEDIVNIAEETHNPTRNLPLAVILSLLIATLLYVTLSLVAVASVPIDQLAGNPAPLALVYETVTGHTPSFMVFIGITAIINGTMIMMIMATRILYGMSHQQWLPGWLGRVHPSTRTPLNSTLLVSSLVLVFAMWLPLDTLATTTSFFTLLVFFAINLSLVVIKYRNPEPEGVRIFPIWLPVAGIISSAGFILTRFFP